MRILPIIIIALIINLVAFHAKAQDTKYIDSLKTVLKTAKEDTNKVKMLFKCANFYSRKEDWLTSDKYNKSAFLLSVKLKDKKNIAAAYNNLGMVDFYKGEFDSALHKVFSALSIWNDIDNMDQKLRTLNNIAIIYQKKGNYKESINYNLQSLKLAEMTNDSNNIINACSNIGNTYYLIKSYNVAIEMYSKTITLSKLKNNKQMIAASYHGLGMVSSAIKKYNEAIDHFNAALEINKEIGNKSWANKNKSSLARVFIKLGEDAEEKKDVLTAEKYYQKAEDYYNECLVYAQQTLQTNSVAIYKNNLGNINFLQGEYALAQEYLDASIELSTKEGDLLLKQQNIESLAQMNQRMAIKNYNGGALVFWPKAYEYYKKATVLKDSLLNETTTKQIAELKTRYETEKKDNQILLLGKENALQLLQLKQKQSDLLLARLEAEQRQADIELLEQTQEIEHLKLNEANQLAEQQELKAKAAFSQVALLKKDKLIKEQEQKQKSLLRNSIFAGITALLLFSGIFIVYRNRNLARIRLSTIRQEISKDLHDDVGGSLSLIRMMSEMIGQQKDLPAPVAANAQKIVESTKDAAQRMNAVIWSMNAENDTLSSFIEYSRHFGYGFFEHCAIDSTVTLNPLSMPQKQLNGLIRKNLFLVLKEAWNNVFKHAQATAVQTTFTLDQNKLLITIEDNGKGFGNHSAFGNGLKNMQKRMEAIGGSFHIANNDKGNGTMVEIKLSI